VTDKSFSAIVIGTGFASSFFLQEYLRHAGPSDQILVVERGPRVDPAWRFKSKISGPVRFNDLIVNRTPEKPWIQTIGFGGGTCWTGTTPRMHPNDFRTFSLYGVGEDWPLQYDDLEEYYARTEQIMGVGGALGPYPRSAPYPYPPHRLSAFDELLAKKYPGQHLPVPSARSSSIKTGRPVCCPNGVCSVCPISAKFQVDLHMAHIYDDPRVTLVLEADAQRVDIAGNRASGLVYTRQGKQLNARADVVVVGAHAIMTPYVLLRSGLRDKALGRYLNEQISCEVQVDLAGVNNFDGGQQVSGHGLMFLDGKFRSRVPGCLVESWNVPWLRADKGRWRQRALLKFVFEDVPDFKNYVSVATEDSTKPAVHYSGHSSYMKSGLSAVPRLVEELTSGLPVESFAILPGEGLGGSAHIQGTTRMGQNPDTSLVDRDLRHHLIRNLVVLGSGTFPTCPAANPTLTLSALAMRSAERLFN
jgi:choline dehydrogenase-like flavoprotein